VFDDTPVTAHLRRKAHRIAELLVCKAEPFDTDAVLAFVGYGEDEYFPTLYQVTVSGSIGGVLRRYDESRTAVGAETGVTITPLGMTEAINTFLRGVSPEYRSVAHAALDQFAESLDLQTPESVKQVEAAHRRLEDELKRMEWDIYLTPMLDVVETLPIAETVRLADALVGLATLRQVVRGDSTVGGPIDVARITRDDGFAWVRHKDTSRP